MAGASVQVYATVHPVGEGRDVKNVSYFACPSRKEEKNPLDKKNLKGYWKNLPIGARSDTMLQIGAFKDRVIRLLDMKSQ